MDHSCTFYGNRDASPDIIPSLQKVLVNLIKTENVKQFYVGQQGQFDIMTSSVLAELEKQFSIRYSIVLHKIPVTGKPLLTDMSHTIYPEGLETVPPRYAIDHRNRWMLDQCDYVVTYVRNPYGGAEKYKELAIKKHKTVIELYQH